MARPNENWRSYLGDGVYAIFDGYGFWLHANSHDNPTDSIYIEPDVYDALIKYVDRLKKENNTNGEGEENKTKAGRV